MSAGEKFQSRPLSSPALLRKVDELRERNISQHVPLPQLVVVGDQSSGKSSLLESLTGIPFPHDLELCTRYATQITSRRDPSSFIMITIVPGPHATEAHRNNLEEYCPEISTIRDLREKFSQILQEVRSQNDHRIHVVDNCNRAGRMFSEDVLKIETWGPSEDYLTVIDVPGIFRSLTEGVMTKEDIVLNSRTVILAVIPANVDIATQEILSFAEEYDQSGERTLGVLTKPDLVKERSAQEVVCSVMMGRKKRLALGYHIVRNRGADESEVFDYHTAEHIFHENPWDKLPRDRVGEFPDLRREIQKQLEDCQRDLAIMGPARHTEQAQRLFLSEIARKYETFVHAALEAQYSIDDVFDKNKELRLITYVVNLAKQFSDDFEKKAHHRIFSHNLAEPLSNIVVYNEADEEVNSEVYEESDGQDIGEAFYPHSKESTRRESLLADIVFAEFPILDSILSDDYHLEDPIGGIMDWTEQLFLESRSVDLGTFSGAILSSAFKDKVVYVVHRFVVITLSTLCRDEHIREEIWSDLQDEILQRHKMALDQAMFLVNIEREKRPYTLNHYFNENLQQARNRRSVSQLRSKGRVEESRYPNKNAFVSSPTNAHMSSTKVLIDLDTIAHATVDKSNLEHVKEEIHDILQSYYKVARKRLVDNLYSQVVDHCLLSGPNSPLSAFSQEWVIKLDAERLETIAGDSLADRTQREGLVKKIEDLNAAVQILKR
ncbi:interferon-induced GTP-binding protein Mx2 [Tothia fuscella]|uniref:Interferon-induced GTP-binding protein Mx2 n=1 Tax=Tothia fuscella TaxID=1048955 RepID=A0A9P4NMI6_9PEZI|nr:interferon-induced GTP-binding protein Mx2 [Tothia fuscella]